MNLIKVCEDAKIASRDLSRLKSIEKDTILKACSNALLDEKDIIINANKIDIKNAKENNIKIV